MGELIMENKTQVNPNYALDVLFEKVQELTREAILKDAYIRQLEAEIKLYNEATQQETETNAQ